MYLTCAAEYAPKKRNTEIMKLGVYTGVANTYDSPRESEREGERKRERSLLQALQYKLISLREMKGGL